MKMSLLVAIVDSDSSHDVVRAARDSGAAGATVIQRARGGDYEGLRRVTGLALDAGQDVVLLTVPGAAAAAIVGSLEALGVFKNRHGSGILFQLEVEDSVGLRRQLVDAGSSEEQEWKS